MSSDGRVREVGQDRDHRQYNDHGHKCVSIAGGKHRVARLVARAFLPPPQEHPSRLVVAHVDGDKTNNRVDNLRWETRSQMRLKAAAKRGIKSAVWMCRLGSGERLGLFRAATVAA